MSCPIKIKQVSEDEDKLIKKHYKGYIRPFVRAGPAGYLCPPRYADHAADIYNLVPRPDDIWVVTFSRSGGDSTHDSEHLSPRNQGRAAPMCEVCGAHRRQDNRGAAIEIIFGTTWLQELVWLVANGIRLKAATETPLSKRFTFIEFPTFESEVRKEPENPNEPRAMYDDFRTLPNLPSPRYVKTHLPLSLLPPKLLDVSKVFYVARDPRDVAVSYYFMHKLFRYFDEGTTFKDFWELFKKDLVLHTPIFAHIAESWAKRTHPNLMFLFYEDMQKDLLGVIERVCSFLGRDYSPRMKQRLAQHLSFDNMAATSDVTTNKDEDTEVKFMRKGKSGDWVNYFDDEMKKEADEYMEKHLSNTDMRFPTV